MLMITMPKATQRKELNVNNISVDPKCYEEWSQTAEAYKLHNGLEKVWATMVMIMAKFI